MNTYTNKSEPILYLLENTIVNYTKWILIEQNRVIELSSFRLYDFRHVCVCVYMKNREEF